ncbi:MAG TPA: hypothetical protein ENL27_00315 [Candidatus Parcubacteria bacterium]|nr:hypothetical protein [Candidatus Parcubacteria bacterium]
MNEKFKELLEELKRLNLPDGGYAIYGSGPMAVRGLRDANDLDIVVKDELYEKLREKYKDKEIKTGHIKIGDIEIFASFNSLIDNPEEVIDRTEELNGFRFIRLEDLIRWKQKLGREKDLKDIKLIKKYLAENRKNK